jgi:hypothetical protein
MAMVTITAPQRRAIQGERATVVMAPVLEAVRPASDRV